MIMALLKLSDPYSAFLEAAPQFMEVNSETAAFAKNELELNPNLTIGEMIDRSTPHMGKEGNEWMETCFVATIRCRELWGNLLDIEVREKYCEAVKTPFRAFMIYIKVDDLTNAEDAILESKFIGKLPAAEKELMDGIVKRAKQLA
jgi:hypothetical protein